MGRVHLRAERDVAVLTIDSPGRLNAFTRAMRADIRRVLADVETDARYVGAVLTGAGEAFCAGQDFNESSAWDEATPWVEEFELFARAIAGFKKPLVAAVNGVAAGGGFQAALMCDRRVGHAGTRMGQTEVRWGLASVTGTWLLQRSVGDARARELVLSGRLMEADELLRLGLIDAVVPRETVLDAALAACRRLAEAPAGSFARTKTWLYESLSEELRQVFGDAVRLHRLGFASGESQAGAVGFLQSRHDAMPKGSRA
jgi:enoyl-CoA hydratase/carnithine racemase